VKCKCLKLATGSNQINTFRLFLTTLLHRFNYAATAAPYHDNGDDAVGTPAERRRYAASLRSTALSIILRVFTGIPNQLFVCKPAVWVFADFLSPCTQIPDQLLKLSHDRFHSMSFPNRHCKSPRHSTIRNRAGPCIVINTLKTK
jgi:hypothetical protein